MHTGVEHTLALFPDLLSNIIHTLKCLGEAGMMKQPRARIRAEIPKRLRIHHGGSPPDESMRFTECAIRILLPPCSAPCRRGHVQATLDFLNGNWLCKGVLKHFCCAPGCCRDHQEAQEKLQRHLGKALTCDRPTMLAHNNWRDWSRQVATLKIKNMAHNLPMFWAPKYCLGSLTFLLLLHEKQGIRQVGSLVL